ncbi:MAG TPA: DUF3866 family protein, partial [Acidimicrobiia bacterium]|nr:DUF3866 family protein [Acidimicrobiia bacterium]
RERHRGVSHHSRTALGVAVRSRVTVAMPPCDADQRARLHADMAASGIEARHEVVPVDPGDVLDLLTRQGLDVTSMGRKASEDPLLHACAAAAGHLAASWAVAD